VGKLDDFDPLRVGADVQLVHESGDKFQGFPKVGDADAHTAVEQDHRVQFGRKPLFGDLEAARLFAILAIEVPTASAEIAFLVGEAIAAILTRIFGAGIVDERLLAEAAGPTAVTDADADALAGDAFPVSTANSGADVADDLLVAIGSLPTVLAEANGFGLVGDAPSVAAMDVVARIQNFPLADVANSPVAWNVVPAITARHLLQAIFVTTPVVWHLPTPMAAKFLSVQPSPFALFLCADEPSVCPRSKHGDFAKDTGADVRFDGVSLDVLTHELVSLVGLRVGQSPAFALALHQGIVEGLLILGESEARVMGTRDVVKRTEATLA